MNERNYLLKPLLVSLSLSEWFGSHVTFTEMQTNIYWLPSSSRHKYLMRKHWWQSLTNSNRMTSLKPSKIIKLYQLLKNILNQKVFLGMKTSRGQKYFHFSLHYWCHFNYILQRCLHLMLSEVLWQETSAGWEKTKIWKYNDWDIKKVCATRQKKN